MGAIAYRQFGSLTKPYLTLGQETFVRRFSFGSDWTTLRIGLLLTVTPNGQSDVSDIKAFFGVCNASGGGVGQRYCMAAYGFVIDSSFLAAVGSGVLTYNATQYQMRVANSVETRSVSGWGSPYWTVDAISFWTIYFSKGSASSSAANPGVITARAGFSAINFADYAAHLDYATVNADMYMNGATWSTSANTGSQVAPPSVAGYPLDALCIHWGRGSYPLNIYGMVVYRVS